MSAPRNGGYIVQQTRDLLFEHENNPLYDGWAAPGADEGPISIVKWMHVAIGELCPSGIVKCYFTMEGAQGEPVYRFDNQIHFIEAVEYDDEPLVWKPWDVITRNKTWRSTTSGTPRFWSSTSNLLLLDPPPDTTDAAGSGKIRFFAESTIADLATANDIPGFLPVWFHERIAFGAARLLNPMLFESNVEAKSRQAIFEKAWEDTLVEMNRISQKRYNYTGGYIPVGYLRGRWKPHARYRG
jgi:hypothetical protein